MYSSVTPKETSCSISGFRLNGQIGGVLAVWTPQNAVDQVSARIVYARMQVY